MNFERHRRGGRRITERGTLEERHVETEMRLLQPRQIGHFATRREGERGGVKVLKRGRRGWRKEKFHGENERNEREGRGEEVDGKRQRNISSYLNLHERAEQRGFSIQSPSHSSFLCFLSFLISLSPVSRVPLFLSFIRSLSSFRYFCPIPSVSFENKS